MPKHPARTPPKSAKPAPKAQAENASSSTYPVPPQAPPQNTARIFRIAAGIPMR